MARKTGEAWMPNALPGRTRSLKRTRRNRKNVAAGARVALVPDKPAATRGRKAEDRGEVRAEALCVLARETFHSGTNLERLSLRALHSWEVSSAAQLPV